MVWIKWAALVFAALAAFVAAVVAYGTWRWAARARALVERIEAARVTAAPARYDAARELAGLPAPVQRYFRTVLTNGQPIVAAATVEHRGTFNLGETIDQWRPFTSRQRVVTRRPGFVWDGRVAMLPGLNVLVHDAYVAGEGILHAALFGLLTLIDLRGTGEVAQGELLRFFAEAAWYPTALLPSQGVRWEPVDDPSARATLVDGPQSLTMTFGFASDGTMQSVGAEGRGRTVAGRIVMTPWEGRWSDVQAHDGMRGTDDWGSCVAHAARPQAILARDDDFVELRLRALNGGNLANPLDLVDAPLLPGVQGRGVRSPQPFVTCIDRRPLDRLTLPRAWSRDVNVRFQPDCRPLSRVGRQFLVDRLPVLSQGERATLVRPIAADTTPMVGFTHQTCRPVACDGQS